MTKKDLEAHWLGIAQSCNPSLFPGTPVPSESPDFILVSDAVRLGVELTRFTFSRRPGRPIPEEQTGRRRKILILARRQVDALSGTHLRVGIVFSDHVPIEGSRIPAIVDAIARCLCSTIVDAPVWTRARWVFDGDPQLPAEISRVFATVVPSIANTPWYPADAGWVSYVDENDIHRVVSAKESKLTRYESRCDRAMLLIVFEGRPQDSRVVHAPETNAGIVVRTGFASILCLDVLEKRLVELAVLPRAA